jgi:hypothetical protein
MALTPLKGIGGISYVYLKKHLIRLAFGQPPSPEGEGIG